jgi:hypothetical protein
LKYIEGWNGEGMRRRDVSLGLFGCKILMGEDKLRGNDNEMGKIAKDDDGSRSKGKRERGNFILFYLLTHSLTK